MDLGIVWYLKKDNVYIMILGIIKHPETLISLLIVDYRRTKYIHNHHGEYL